MPSHMMNIVASLTEIPPLSTDIVSHKTGVNRQTAGQMTNNASTTIIS